VCLRTNPKCRLRECLFFAAFAPGFVSRWDMGDELVGAGRRDCRLSPASPELPGSSRNFRLPVVTIDGRTGMSRPVRTRTAGGVVGEKPAVTGLAACFSDESPRYGPPVVLVMKRCDEWANVDVYKNAV